MRFRELLEYKRDVTAKNLGDKIYDRIKSQPESLIRLDSSYIETGENTFFQLPDWTPENRTWVQLTSDPEGEFRDRYIDLVLYLIELADPTNNKQYTLWLVNRYIDGTFRYLEDVHASGERFLKGFHQLKVRRLLDPEYRDINRIKGSREFENALTYVEIKLDDYEKNKPKKLTKGESTVVYEDEYVRVIEPKDEAAACYYGQGTRWCTAATDGTNFFNSYNADGPLLIILPKKTSHDGEKYQLHFESNQFMNEKDNPIDLYWLLKERFENSELYEWLNEKHRLSNTLQFMDEGLLIKVMEVIYEIAEQHLHEMIFDSEFGDEDWQSFIDDNGARDEDGDIDYDKLSMSYGEYSGWDVYINELRNLVILDKSELNDLLIKMDSDVFAWGLNNLPELIRMNLEEADRNNEYVFGSIGEYIERHVSVDTNLDKDDKVIGWRVSTFYKTKKKGTENKAGSPEYDTKEYVHGEENYDPKVVYR